MTSRLPRYTVLLIVLNSFLLGCYLVAGRKFAPAAIAAASIDDLSAP